jgi:hypothetical protein
MSDDLRVRGALGRELGNPPCLLAKDLGRQLAVRLLLIQKRLLMGELVVEPVRLAVEIVEAL